MMGTRPATLDETFSERLEPPHWIGTLLGANSTQFHTDTRGIDVRSVCSGEFAFITATVRDADTLDAADFQQCVEHAYMNIHAALRDTRSPHPVRFWNFIPHIGRPMGDGLDRYMVFNVGRYRAFLQWYGKAQFGELIATASGVGHRSGDLLIHCLASGEQGAAVENPRQVPAYNYSSQYGPRPPSFARGTVCFTIAANDDGAAPGPILLVGGTASICGEHSRHQRDVVQQTRETLENLDALVEAAWRRFDGSRVSSGGAAVKQPAACFQQLRIYLVRPEHYELVVPAVADRFPNARLEWRRADLCRPELLVEIEGVAEWPFHHARPPADVSRHALNGCRNGAGAAQSTFQSGSSAT